VERLPEERQAPRPRRQPRFSAGSAAIPPSQHQDSSHSQSQAGHRYSNQVMHRHYFTKNVAQVIYIKGLSFYVCARRCVYIDVAAIAGSLLQEDLSSVQYYYVTATNQDRALIMIISIIHVMCKNQGVGHQKPCFQTPARRSHCKSAAERTNGE